MNRVAGIGQATLGVFFPMLGKLADFHSDLIARLLVAGRVSAGFGRRQPLYGLLFRLAITTKV
ncbi:hypothetical protein D3C80_2222840 [compost metagenome]